MPGWGCLGHSCVELPHKRMLKGRSGVRVARRCVKVLSGIVLLRFCAMAEVAEPFLGEACSRCFLEDAVSFR